MQRGWCRKLKPVILKNVVGRDWGQGRLVEKRKEQTEQGGLGGAECLALSKGLWKLVSLRDQVSGSLGLNRPPPNGDKLSLRKIQVSSQRKYRKAVDLKQGDQVSRFSQDHPGFSTQSAMFQETLS